MQATTPRRRWTWLLGAFLLLCLVALMTSLTFLGLMDGARDGLNIVVAGEHFRVTGPPGWEFGLGSIVVGAVAVMVLLLVVSVVVPLAVAGTLLCVLLGVGLAVLAAVVGLAAGLACLLLVVALALSPLWGLGLLLWLLFRRPRPAATH